MALHTLKIVVVDGGRASNVSIGGNTGTTKTTQKVDKESPLYKLLNAKEIIKEKTIGKLTPASAYTVGTFGRLAIQTAKSAFSYYISDIGRSTGDSNYQAIVNKKYELLGEVMGLVGGMVSGATAGFMTTANPIGAVAGAVLGFTSSAVSLGFKHAEQDRAYRHTMAEEKAGIDYNRGRMTGGTGVRVR